MNTITKQKPIEEIEKYLEKDKKIYLIGCGTCATMIHVGGKEEVLKMKETMEQLGKTITGWMVVPTACDDMTGDAIDQNAESIAESDSILVLACAFGVQRVAQNVEKAVYPALNTMFIGQDDGTGDLSELCIQCGDCVLGLTVGICPITRCSKSLLNGPCGGSVEGKCEISPDIPCAWQMIIDRLTKLGLVDRLEEIVPPKDWSHSVSGGPRTIARSALE